MSPRRRVVLSAASLLLVAGACMSAPNNGAIPLSTTSTPSRTGATLSGAQRDSMFAQAIAEREGPRISVSAEFSYVSNSARRLRAHVRLDDDAYVIVGQISPDGILRIVFPENPTDDGFLRGNHSYQTAEFFGGFEDQFRYRLATSPYGRFGPATRDSYDNGFGFVFAIASWRPMRFDQFSSGGTWDSFELVDNEYLRDPRPAVYELAALLAGANRETYTVEFAHYTSTRYASYGSPYGFGSYGAYGYGFCSGFAPLGYASTPFGFSLFDANLPFGESFYYRGQYYSYNAFGDCYTRGLPYRYGSGGYVMAQGVTPPSYRARGFTVGGRTPGQPELPRAKISTGVEQSPDGKSLGVAHVSPVYRTRGLLTNDESDPGVPGRGPRTEPATRTRPTIQEMVNRHVGDQQDVRARIAGDESGPSRNQPSRFDTPTRGRESSGNDSRGTYNRPTSSDGPRVSPRTESPRTESPRVESPRSEPRTESPRVSVPPPRSESPRSESPRSESPRVESPRSSPPPAPAPRSEAPPPRPPEVKSPGR